jgi:DNA-binding MarR family transcriptional regulator
MSTITREKQVQNMSTEDIFMVFIKFLMLSKHRIIELGAGYDLTAMQTLTLFLLDQPRPMHNFKKIFNCDASNITGLVDGLEQKRLVSRFEDPSDRRIKMVRLERRGREVRRALLRTLSRREGPLLSRLTPAELRTLIDLLQKLTLEK